MAGIGFGNWSITAAGRRAKRTSDYQPQHVSVTRRLKKPYTIRLWSVRNARFFEALYEAFADLFLKLHPFWTPSMNSFQTPQKVFLHQTRPQEATELINKVWLVPSNC